MSLSLIRAESLWKGSFRSSVYPLYVKGSIEIVLPDSISLKDLKMERDYDAKITYLGMFRYGNSYELDVKSEIKDGDLIMRTYIQYQMIEFSCSHITEDKISGTYISSNPSDTGSFELF